MPLYSANPPSYWQFDHGYIERKMSYFMEFLGCTDTTGFGMEQLKRNVKYIRDKMNEIFLQRADQTARIEHN